MLFKKNNQEQDSPPPQTPKNLPKRATFQKKGIGIGEFPHFEAWTRAGEIWPPSSSTRSFFGSGCLEPEMLEAFLIVE